MKKNVFIKKTKKKKHNLNLYFSCKLFYFRVSILCNKIILYYFKFLYNCNYAFFEILLR